MDMDTVAFQIEQFIKLSKDLLSKREDVLIVIPFTVLHRRTSRLGEAFLCHGLMEKKNRPHQFNCVFVIAG